MAAPFDPSGWRAETLARLRAVWAGLKPESAEKDTERRFDDRLLTPEGAGDVFERWVLEAFRLSGATGHEAYRVPLYGSEGTREQIDGLVFDGWQAFVMECKFWADKVDFGPIALFHTILDNRTVGTLGLFFSAFGYTLPALQSAELLRPLRVLLFDARDLQGALGRKPFKNSMAEMVRRRWMLVVKVGRPYAPPSSVLDLFNSSGGR
jgi:hypothetical protein